MKYLIYSRVSTIDQNVETQNKQCYRLIEELGGTDITLFSDPDCSTSLPMKKRTGLQALLKALTADCTVVIYDLDRLSRDIIEMVTIYRTIKKTKCKLTSVTDPHCDNEFKINIMGAIAQEEKRKTIQRTLVALKEKQYRMEKVGTTWYGYTLDETQLQLHKEGACSYGKPYKLIPHETEYKGLCLMVELQKEGISFQKIANRMTGEGYCNRAGKPFQRGSVHRILRRQERLNPVHGELVL